MPSKLAKQGMAMSWPGRITDVGRMRTQFHHVIDIAPAFLEAANIPQPATIHGVAQLPMDGVSMAYTWAAAAGPSTPSKRTTQYFEMLGNRAIYHDGWVACTRHSIPWLAAAKLPPVKDDVWELCKVDEDFSQAENLAAKNPAKLKELQAVFEKEAVLFDES